MLSFGDTLVRVGSFRFRVRGIAEARGRVANGTWTTNENEPARTCNENFCAKIGLF
jgi:hypothetical protein